MKETAIVPTEVIENKIYIVRGQKVMLDRDLAALYGVENFQLKRQVKRNVDRFPEDFMFVLTEQEIEHMVCHFGIPSKSYFGGSPPFAFTEQGISMLSSVLNCKRAVYVNIQIMRAFVKLRRLIASHGELRRKIELLEKRVFKHDSDIRELVRDIRRLTIEKSGKDLKKIGFEVK